MVKRILFKLLERKNYYVIRKHCTFGANTKFGMRARCICEEENSIQIGDHCEINGSLITQDKGRIVIGDHVTIRYETKIGAVNSITIGNNVIISNHVIIYDNNNHPTDVKSRRAICQDFSNQELWKWKHSVNQPVVIKDDVWIGQGAVILKGVTIGEGSIVGMNAVVTKDVPAYSVAVGNPARIVKQVEKE